MAPKEPLRTTPAPPTTGRDESYELVFAAPMTPYNIRGLSVIRYRIGTFTSFRRAMLDQVARQHLPEHKPNPFTEWREGTVGDYHTLLLELWAYLADILTFYQERIANEAYLPTATQRDSLVRLAQLINYHPSPGAAANVLLAFTVEPGKLVDVPPGFRVGSRALPGKPAVVYETEGGITARGEHSAIPVAKTHTPDQFAPLPDGHFTRSVKLQSIATGLSPGDYILIVENASLEPPAPIPYLKRLISVCPDKATNTTTIEWSDDPGVDYADVALYAMRIQAAPFGHSLPGLSDSIDISYATSSAQEADPTYLYLDAVYPGATVTPEAPGWVALVSDSSGTEQADIFPVTNVRTVTAVAPIAPHVQTTAAATTSVDARQMSARVTRLTLTLGTADNGFDASQYPLHTTTILTGAERLTRQVAVPWNDPVAGGTVPLEGHYAGLRRGQPIVVQGYVYNDCATKMPTLPTLGAEARIIADVSSPDPVSDTTIITLDKPLLNRYVRASTVVFANVVNATQGETVHQEILGSGDGSAFQAYALKQKPLTHLSSIGSQSPAALESTLAVTVNGIRWSERPALLESTPTAQEYTTTLDDAGQTTVIFGDGVHGARPSTGSDNIQAHYRKGLGAIGNVEPDAIQQLIDSMPGLQKVTNPNAAFGGADREDIGQLRTNVPASVGTFGRAVGVADYAALARTYPGVAKASASWVCYEVSTGKTRATTRRAVPQPYIQLTVATSPQDPGELDANFAHNLRDFLDKRRDPNVAMRIASYTPVYIDVAATIDIDEHYPRAATLAAARAALNPGRNPNGTFGYFAFDRLHFGQSIYLSGVYAALQAVPGIHNTTITTLRRLDQSLTSASPPDDIFIRPTELAVIRNDPNDSANQYGKLTLTLGRGGFIDT